jgi:hypothetical protein
MNVAVDAKAARLLGHRRPGQAVLITILCTYALPIETLTVEQLPEAWAAPDPDLAYLGTLAGVPLYAHRRLAAYARWHPLTLTASGLWWPSLAVEGADEVLRDLAFWERTHPNLSDRGAGSASAA